MKTIVLLFISFLYLNQPPSLRQDTSKKEPNCEDYYAKNLYNIGFSGMIKQKKVFKNRYQFIIVENNVEKALQFYITTKSKEIFDICAVGDYLTKEQGGKYLSVAHYVNTGQIDVKKHFDLCK